jgi:hypothetical protein
MSDEQRGLNPYRDDIRVLHDADWTSPLDLSPEASPAGSLRPKA